MAWFLFSRVFGAAPVFWMRWAVASWEEGLASAIIPSRSVIFYQLHILLPCYIRICACFRYIEYSSVHFHVTADPVRCSALSLKRAWTALTALAIPAQSFSFTSLFLLP